MCWGFCCGDGWFDIIDELRAQIAGQVNAGTMPPVVAARVKSKAGYLRSYIRGHFRREENPQAHRLIALAQQKAERACEECGLPGERLDEAEFLGVICPACAAVQ